jgi:hypothetical protein
MVLYGMSVEHRPEESRFVADLSGSEAELTYRKVNEKTLDYLHTYVPPELRGAGIGGELVKEALEFARERGFNVRPSCHFVASFMERHPEYKELEADQ